MFLQCCHHPLKNTGYDVGNTVPKSKYLQISIEDGILLPETLKVIAIGFDQTHH